VNDPYPKEEGDWICTYSMRIDEVRLLHDAVCSHIEMWPGTLAGRPAEEIEYLKYLRTQLFAMMTEYTFTHITHEVDE